MVLVSATKGGLGTPQNPVQGSRPLYISDFPRRSKSYITLDDTAAPTDAGGFYTGYYKNRFIWALTKQ